MTQVNVRARFRQKNGLKCLGESSLEEPVERFRVRFCEFVKQFAAIIALLDEFLGNESMARPQLLK